MMWLLILIVIFAGAMVPLQAGVNSELAKLLNHPMQAAIISFVGGVLGTCIVLLCFRVEFPSLGQIKSVPPYLLFGGFLGLVMVLTAIYLAPRLGATTFIASILAGQLIASIVLDHFGFLSFSPHPITTMRVVGVGFLLTGVALIRLF